MEQTDGELQVPMMPRCHYDGMWRLVVLGATSEVTADLNPQ